MTQLVGRIEHDVDLIQRMRYRYNNCITELAANDIRMNTSEVRQIKKYLRLIYEELARDYYTLRASSWKAPTPQIDKTYEQLKPLREALEALNYQDWTGETLLDQQLGTLLQTIYEQQLQQLHTTIHQTK